MTFSISGLHHVTAIARDPQKNAEFYLGMLGLRLVKRTVNFDDRETYHLYYGDVTGQPGTLLTFFVRPDEESGRRGRGQVTAVRFSVPPGSLAYWAERLARHDVPFGALIDGPDPQALMLSDPDGLQVHLVAAPDAAVAATSPNAVVPAERAIRGLHSVAVSVSNVGPTCAVLTGAMGFVETWSGPDRRRFAAAGGGPGLFVDVMSESGLPEGSIAAGSVHHVAFRARDSREQRAWQDRLRAAGLAVTDVKDRKYFRSIYFHEPGGVRLEIATDGPGFTVDESPEELGRRLQVPEWLESQREGLEIRLGRLPAV